ncbi:MAG: hypothetical protein HON07_07850, partial [Planctomycetaceae bacterium]|nr:hypothetical protein [Planctomycetaceae bacterium]
MRQDLVGYLFDSLDEKERVEIDLARQNQDVSSGIEKDLAAIQRAIEPLKCDDGFIDPPAGLAARTIAAVKQSSVSKGPALSPASDSGSIVQPRIWLDRTILAAASIAAIILLAP